ncbi:MAG: hypothetical protein P8Z38_07895 [Robiginitalea sp.]
MERKIKLIWDFRGPDSFQTASHYLRHLRESPLYTPERTSGVDSVSNMHCITYLLISETEIPRFRDALKPHRAVYAE